MAGLFFILVARQRASSTQQIENKRVSAEIDRDRGVDSHRQRRRIC